ncbi:LytR/AlgR family response regulator transcription factor [Pedobacter sp.]|uniref:LytR/AlgR family response regulator transcription factor n=1 Tax=Pedobacter sp. TaxID=1411316 RepID=UPI00396C9EBB
MNCLIVDDQDFFRTAMKGMLSFDPSLILAGECSNAVEAYQKISTEPIDLVLLDIKMPGTSGIELAKLLEGKRTLIIFTTSEPSYAAEAFDLNVVDFLVKPVTPVRFLKAIEKAKEIIKNKSIAFSDVSYEYAFIRESNAIKRIKIDDIIFLEATGDYVKIFFANQTYSIYSTFKEIEQKLPGDIFLRVHRSFIVNLNKIDTAEGKTLIINNHFVPVSNTYKADLNKRMRFL